MNSQQTQKHKNKENKALNEYNISHKCMQLKKKERQRLETKEEYRQHLAKEYDIIIEPELPFEEILDVQQINESDKELLQKFRSEMNKLGYFFCPTYKECFLSMKLVKEECQHCYAEKGKVKKFSANNNMDPNVVLEELKCLTEIEEMLIAQT
ncbi:7380_t:CDS:2 [Gigaspora margarita]|uniref:7380_t:CDS:1 n=1 Tax=Gigaspora margarita TaxID=4874 RepID=A0ABN7UVR4_GIGMA|nr:7380_t:CDS:2 [Gigaspora margarita]